FPWQQWQRSPGIGGRLAMEAVAAFVWNGWQLCRGSSGRIHLESVAALPWNTQAVAPPPPGPCPTPQPGGVSRALSAPSAPRAPSRWGRPSVRAVACLQLRDTQGPYARPCVLGTPLGRLAYPCCNKTRGIDLNWPTFSDRIGCKGRPLAALLEVPGAKSYMRAQGTAGAHGPPMRRGRTCPSYLRTAGPR